MKKSATIKLHDSFNNVVRFKRSDFSHLLIWPDMGRIDVIRKDDYHAVGFLNGGPDTVLSDAEQIFNRLASEGIDLIRLTSQDKQFGVIAFFKPDTIQYFEDDLSAENDNKHCLTVAGMAFELGEDEKADFKHALMQNTPANDWIEFSPDRTGELHNARGHYAFRKSMIIDMFANARDNLLAVQTTDKFRSFVPMNNPNSQITAIAARLPHLTKSPSPAPALPLYYDEKAYPENRRHHMNIIMRR